MVFLYEEVAPPPFSDRFDPGAGRVAEASIHFRRQRGPRANAEASKPWLAGLVNDSHRILPFVGHGLRWLRQDPALLAAGHARACPLWIGGWNCLSLECTPDFRPQVMTGLSPSRHETPGSADILASLGHATPGAAGGGLSEGAGGPSTESGSPRRDL